LYYLEITPAISISQFRGIHTEVLVFDFALDSTGTW